MSELRSVDRFDPVSLFSGDPTLEAEFLKLHNSPAKMKQLEGEHDLMRAILEDALGCLEKYHGKRSRKEFKEAKAWVEEEKADWLFSFNNICETLGLNPWYVRKLIRNFLAEPADSNSPSQFAKFYLAGSRRVSGVYVRDGRRAPKRKEGQL